MKSSGKHNGRPHGKSTKVPPFEIRTALPDVPFYDSVYHIPPVETWVPRVSVWEPMYVKDYGSVCLMTGTDGAHAYYGASSRWVYDTVLEFYERDFHTMRKDYRRCTGQSQSVPVPVPQRDLILFAVKTRHTEKQGQAHNDGAFGYVADTCIRHVEEIEPTKLRVSLATNHEVEVLMTRDSFEAQRHRAEHFRLWMKNRGAL